VARPLERRLDDCSKFGATVACKCGTRVVPSGCGLRWLCETCQRRTYGRFRRRLLRALGAHVHAAQRAQVHGRGKQRRAVLMTLTARHSGDLGRDREVLVAGWRRLRMWLHRRLGGKGKGRFVYALAWELTPGTDGLGHLHAHVVALLPWVDWGDVRTEWLRATGGESLSIDLKSSALGVESAAKYMAKYASKGVQLADLAPEVAAGALDAMYMQRAVSASHGFWLPDPCGCSKCGAAWQVIDRPPGLDVRTAPVWVTHGNVVVVEWGIDEELHDPRKRRPRAPANSLAFWY
jgi:hypothetical protein